MVLGRRSREEQDAFWVATDQLGSGPRNAFYDRLNQLLAEIEFNRKLEKAAEPFYEKTGRRSLPPGVYFRMIFIGYFEDLSSQRGIAWRCEDSRSLARFLGYVPCEQTPDHSTLSLTRERLPMELHISTYNPEPKRTTPHTWADKSEDLESSYRRNRRNSLGVRGRRLQSLRSERLERTFARVCETGGARRAWLSGLAKVRKWTMSAAMTHNLGRIMRLHIGASVPRYAAVLAERLCFIYFAMKAALITRLSIVALRKHQEKENWQISSTMIAL